MEVKSPRISLSDQTPVLQHQQWLSAIPLKMVARQTAQPITGPNQD